MSQRPIHELIRASDRTSETERAAWEGQGFRPVKLIDQFGRPLPRLDRSFGTKKC